MAQVRSKNAGNAAAQPMAEVPDEQQRLAEYRAAQDAERANRRRVHSVAAILITFASLLIAFFSERPLVGLRIGFILGILYVMVVTLDGLTKRWR